MLWYGCGIPLHGLDVIYEAFKILAREREDVTLRVAGSSGLISELERRARRDGASNIKFLGRISRERVVKEIGEADVCLGGHYSTTPKAGNVIAGKVFEMIAMRKPVIVGESVAVKELFVDGEHIVMCERGSARSLADAVTRVCENEVLSKRIAENVYTLYNKKLRPKQVVAPLIKVIKNLAEG